MPMIDILMSTFNGERYVEAQIDSILTQDFRDFRLLIRDDGSTDNTANIIDRASLSDVRIKRIAAGEEGRLGPQSSFMRLLAISDAPFFMFSDQDDVWQAGKISRSFSMMSQMVPDHGDGTPLLLFTDLSVCDENLTVIDASFWHYQRLDPSIANDWRRLLAQNVVTGCTVIGNAAARSVSLPFAMSEMFHDHWVAVNVSRNGRIRYLADPTVWYRQHRGNAEGAIRFNASYSMTKLGYPMRLYYKYRSLGRFFGISPAKLIFFKMFENFARLFRR